jgi:ribosome-binding protein aMBF1 (putative translation factor)
LRQEDGQFQQLADKLKMDVADLMRQCNAKAPPSKALVKGLARELNIMSSSSKSWRKRFGRVSVK